MKQRSITIEHNGVTYAGQIATIESTHLGIEDHGIATAYVHVKGDGWGVGVGGFCLDTPIKDEQGKFLRREGTAFGFDHIMRLVQVVGVSSWEKLKGQQVIVLFKDGQHPWGSSALGLAHPIDEDKVFILRDHADEWLARMEPEAVPA